MSLFDKSKSKRKKNTLSFIEVIDIHNNYIELKNGDCLVFFRIAPKNISAMPQEKIRQEIEGLKTIIALAPQNLELTLFSSYENYDDVTCHYRDLIEVYRKVNPKDIRINLLEDDIRGLNEINATRSGAKEFYVVLRLNMAQRKDMENSIRQNERLISEGGLTPKVLQGSELFDLIQVYLENFKA